MRHGPFSFEGAAKTGDRLRDPCQLAWHAGRGLACYDFGVSGLFAGGGAGEGASGLGGSGAL